MSSFSFDALPLQPPAFTATLGATVVIAPHPDDESLGCGGLLALLRQAGLPVRAVLISDGTMSHPQSVKFPAAARQALREDELRQALMCLGVEASELLCLSLPDSAVPGPEQPLFEEAVGKLRAYFREHQPATVLVPWRRDPHPDHRATSVLVAAALQGLPIRRVEYLVWAWERATPADLPQPDEVTGWRLDITPALAHKQAAIRAHRSQIAPGIIDDDPTGFLLSEQMLAHFAQPFEVYLEDNT